MIYFICSLNQKAMRGPRSVNRITLPYGIPTIIKDSTKFESELMKDIEVSYDTNNSTNVQCVSEQEEIILVTTGGTMPSETTIDLDLVDEENDNESTVTGTDKSAKVVSVQNDSIERNETLNGADDNPSNVKNDDEFNVVVRLSNDSTCEKRSELANGSKCITDGPANDFDGKKKQLSTESIATPDNTGESNDQQPSKTTTTETTSNKRKISISSEDEQPPPAKR